MVHWIEYVDLATPILAESFKIVDGALEIPNRSGTGLAWNEDAVRRYRVD